MPPPISISQNSSTQSDAGHPLKAFSRGICDCLDFIAVQVPHKSAVIVRVVLVSDTWRPFVGAAVFDCGLVKSPDCLPVWSLKSHMDAVARGSRAAVFWSFEAEDNIGRAIVNRGCG
jgi:hypothetical protein